MAVQSSENRREQRLRAAFEFAFDLSLTQNDDGILKYAIRQLDRSGHEWDEWETLEPFLMRSAVHFGHTIDYVVQVLIWRHFTQGDLDVARWSVVINSLIDRHGRLGNDSEVCWLLFAAIVLKIAVPNEVSTMVVQNCGALSIVAVMNLISNGKSDVFEAIFDRISKESGEGPMWPVILEWSSSEWKRHKEVSALIKNDAMIGMYKSNAFTFDSERLTTVFVGVEKSKFTDIASAIGANESSYDDDVVKSDEDTDIDDIEF